MTDSKKFIIGFILVLILIIALVLVFYNSAPSITEEDAKKNLIQSEKALAEAKPVWEKADLNYRQLAAKLTYRKYEVKNFVSQMNSLKQPIAYVVTEDEKVKILAENKAILATMEKNYPVELASLKAAEEAVEKAKAVLDKANDALEKAKAKYNSDAEIYKRFKV